MTRKKFYDLMKMVSTILGLRTTRDGYGITIHDGSFNIDLCYEDGVIVCYAGGKDIRFRKSLICGIGGGRNKEDEDGNIMDLVVSFIGHDKEVVFETLPHYCSKSDYEQLKELVEHLNEGEAE